MDARRTSSIETELVPSQAAAMDVQAYLQRIDYQGSLTPDIELLRSLHCAHLFTVPFENLDIHLGREIVCDEGRILRKIVNEKRGGFLLRTEWSFCRSAARTGVPSNVALVSSRSPRR